MAKLKFPPSLWQYGSNSGYFFGVGSASIGGTGGYTGLIIYKGAMPTPAEIAAMNSSTVPRSADRLVSFNLAGLFQSLTQNVVKLKTTVYSTATASGEATWFMMYGSSSSNAQFEQKVFGTVAMSGGELNINDTNIVSGQSYIVEPITIALPLEFEW